MSGEVGVKEGERELGIGICEGIDAATKDVLLRGLHLRVRICVCVGCVEVSHQF
jgi:hypothetical protein